MPVRTANDLASAVKLFRAYASSLDIDLSYQDFEAEMEAMPGKYAPPAGELLLARYSNSTPVGCVGLRPIDPQGCCEMKRLYVSPEGRGLGLGERLVDAVVKGSQVDRLPRDEAGCPPLNDGGHRGVSKVRVRAHRVLLRDPRDRHDLYAPLSHRALGARVRASNLTRRGGLRSAVPGF